MQASVPPRYAAPGSHRSRCDTLLHHCEDLGDLGEELANTLHIQALKCLAKNSVIGEIEDRACENESVLEAHTLLHNEADKLGNGKYGVRIIELKCNMFVDRFNRKPLLLMLTNEILHRCRCEEVFLTQAEKSALFCGIVGIEGILIKFTVLSRIPNAQKSVAENTVSFRLI